jgi:soluble lytic murein transglycosylase-like protein
MKSRNRLFWLRPKKRYIFIFSALVVCLTLGIAALTMVVKTYKSMESQLGNIATTQLEIKKEEIDNKHRIMSVLPGSYQRQRMILFMRDQIVSEWARVGTKGGLERAYMIAESNMVESEKYPSVDPLFLLALEWKESSFRDSIDSPAGALGLCQIMPTTGRMLMGYFQMEYSEHSLYNIETNIKLSAKYIDILFQDYPSYELILAGYNGGYRQIFYYRDNNPKLASETADYIPKVINKWEGYKTAFSSYNIRNQIVVDEPVTL